jgi:uncharacterized protein YbjQ (UPF0145 family)
MIDPAREAAMLIVTTPDVAGFKVAETFGQVFGVVVRSRGIGGNFVAGLRSLVGGEITEYTQMLEEARRHAVDRLAQNAAIMGADAVLMMRFDSSEIGETMTEVVAYGTAVRLAAADAGARASAASAAAATSVPAGGEAPVFGHRPHTP